jgi:hypothetical protein
MNLHTIFLKKEMLNFYKCTPKDKYPTLCQKAAICANLFGSTCIFEQAFSLMRLNKSTEWNWLANENLLSILWLTQQTSSLIKMHGICSAGSAVTLVGRCILIKFQLFQYNFL